jgi:chemotaxis methyl-accepting protein methylase
MIIQIYEYNCSIFFDNLAFIKLKKVLFSSIFSINPGNNCRIFSICCGTGIELMPDNHTN